METEGRSPDLLSAPLGGEGGPPPARRSWLRALAERRGFRIAAGILVGATAFLLTFLLTSIRRVPEGTVGVRAGDGALLEPGERYLGWRDSSVAVYPVDIDLRGATIQVQAPGGERLRGRLDLRGRLATDVVRALSAPAAAGAPPEERVQAAVVDAVGSALSLREARDLVDASPFALQAPWLPLAGVEQGLSVKSSEVDLVSVESLRAVTARAYQSGGRAAAEAYLERLASRRPGDPAPLCVQGDLARIQRDLARAESLYLQALELDPVLPAPMEVLVVHAHQSGQNLERAERLLRRALERKPDSTPHLNWLSLVLARRGDLRGAESALVRALALDPRDAATAVNLAALMDRQGRRSEAIEQLQRVLDKHPDHPLALYNLGSALAEEDRLDEAIATFERAEKVSPPSVLLTRRMAMAYERRGDLRKAEEYRQKAAALERERQQPGGAPAPK